MIANSKTLLLLTIKFSPKTHFLSLINQPANRSQKHTRSTTARRSLTEVIILTSRDPLCQAWPRRRPHWTERGLCCTGKGEEVRSVSTTHTAYPAEPASALKSSIRTPEAGRPGQNPLKVGCLNELRIE